MQVWKDDEFTEENLKSFVKQKSGVYLPLAGCLEEFDIFAAKLMGAESAGEKGKAMAEAENALTSTPSGDKSKAEIYVKIMRKVVRDGLEVPMKEIARIIATQILVNPPYVDVERFHQKELH